MICHVNPQVIGHSRYFCIKKDVTDSLKLLRLLSDIDKAYSKFLVIPRRYFLQFEKQKRRN